ncbi:hypothetical protein ES708_06229 [subsurface metagenome]
MLKESQRLLHRHIQHLGDVLALEPDLQSLAVIALALANLAGDGDIGQELHLNLYIPLPPAGFATPALNVKGEAPRGVAPHPGLGHGGEKLADRSESACIGSRVAAGGTPDRRLVDIDHLVYVLNTDDIIALPRPLPRAVKELRQLLIKDIVDEGALAATGNAGDADEFAQRYMYVDILQVILPRPLDDELLAVAGAALGR